MSNTTKKFSLSLLLFILGCKAGPSRPGMERGSVFSADPSPNTGNGDETLKAGVTPTATALHLKNVLDATALSRLSHREWENSVRDLLQLQAVPGSSKDFTPDSGSTLFANEAASLDVSSTLVANYATAATALGAKIASDKTVYSKLITVSAPAADGLPRARAIVTPLLKRAYRRKPTPIEVMAAATLYVNAKTALISSSGDAAGFAALIPFLLQSPYFLYRIEVGGSPAGNISTLNAYELASRLSFALWESIPDDLLLATADDGSLLNDSVRSAQIQRMMLSPKANPTLEYFNSQIFAVPTFTTIHRTDKKWPADLGDAMVDESKNFFNEVVNTQNKGLNELLTAPYTFVNSVNAPFYGVTATSKAFKKVALDTEKRSGVLTQLGFLTVTSDDSGSLLLHRGGLFVKDMLCGIDLAAPSVVPADSKTVYETQRKRVEATTTSCGASCHAPLLNPLGSAFENYDQADNG
ncbi:MAG: DUF1592 domain-containing protein [Chitinophagaceae bacterium]|nr:DUF1592 domain-containing protein [Oligoflexus sp.]